MKKQYRLTDEQLKRVKEASQPTPAMFLSGGQPMFDSPQENANRVWEALGKEMGFKWNTGQPAPTGDPHDFLAEETHDG